MAEQGLVPTSIQVSVKYRSVASFNTTADIDVDLLKAHIAADLGLDPNLISLEVANAKRRHLLLFVRNFQVRVLAIDQPGAISQSPSLEQSLGNFFLATNENFSLNLHVEPVVEFVATFEDDGEDTNNAGIDALNANALMEDMELDLSAQADTEGQGVSNDAEEFFFVMAPPPPPPDAPSSPTIPDPPATVSYQIQNGRFVTVVPTEIKSRQQASEMCSSEYGGTLAIVESALDYYHVKQMFEDAQLVSDGHTKFWIGAQKICVGSNNDVCLWKWDRGGLVGSAYAFSSWSTEGAQSQTCSYTTNTNWFGTDCDDATVTAFVCDLTVPPSPPPPFAFGAAPPPPQFVRDENFVCPDPSVDTTTSGGLVTITVTFYRTNETSSPVTSWTFDSNRVSSDPDPFFPAGTFSGAMFHAVDFEGVCTENGQGSFNGSHVSVPLCGDSHFWTVSHEVDTSQPRCPNRYTATISKRYGELRAMQLDDGSSAITHDGNAYNFKLTWTLFVFEFAQIDSKTIVQHITPFPNEIDITETVSVAILVDGGILNPDVLVEMHSLLSERSGEDEGTTTFGINGYVRQTPTSQQIRIGEIQRPTFSGSNLDSVSCNDVTLSIEQEGVAFGDLPESIRRRTLDSGDITWVKYEIQSACTVSFTPINPLNGFKVNIPSLSFAYQLQSNTIDSNVFRNVGSGGTFAFEASFTVEPPKDSTISLVLEGYIKSLGETNITSVESGTMEMEDLISTAPMKSTESVAWSERIAFHIQLADAEQRTRMRLQPVFLMFTAHLVDPEDLSTGDFSYNHVTQSSLEDETFCNLNTANAAAILEVDDGHQNWANNNLKAELSGLDIIYRNEIPTFTGITNQVNYHVNDTTGGFAVPLRNTLRLPTGEAGGFSLRMCAVTELVPLAVESGPQRKLLVIETTPFNYVSEDTSPPHSQRLMAYFEPPSNMHQILNDNSDDPSIPVIAAPSHSKKKDSNAPNATIIIVAVISAAFVLAVSVPIAICICGKVKRQRAYRYVNNV